MYFNKNSSAFIMFEFREKLEGEDVTFYDADPDGSLFVLSEGGEDAALVLKTEVAHRIRVLNLGAQPRELSREELEERYKGMVGRQFEIDTPRGKIRGIVRRVSAVSKTEINLRLIDETRENVFCSITVTPEFIPEAQN